MGRIPSSFIDDLISRVDIVEVVDSAVPLRRAGKNHVACCPFHKEKTPSFSVSPDKQFYYCFGCGANGNAVGFMMEYHHQSFVEAVENLAQRVGMQVPREAGGPSKEERQKFLELYQLLDEANRYYQGQLRNSADKDRAVDYLKGRGLSGQIAKQFEIGYAPPGWSNLLNDEGLQKVPAKHFVQAGLSIAKNEQGSNDRALQYDRFRDRIIFPIRDQRGRTIAFGGRVLGDDKPKYLNSPETPVFTKGQELYGLYEAKQANNRLNKLLVVEGYMDVIALAQMGIPYGVATLGTSISSEHLHTVFRSVQEVVFCFDGDDAGRRAAERALNTALPFMQDGRQIRFLFLEEGQDPDSVVREHGPELFEDQVNNAQALSDFMFDHLAQQTDIETMDGRAKLVKLATPLINQMPKGIFFEMMIERLADFTRLDKSIIAESLAEAHSQEKTKAAEREKERERYQNQAAKEAPSQAKPPENPIADYDNMPPSYEGSYDDQYIPNAEDVASLEGEIWGEEEYKEEQVSTVNALIKLILQNPNLPLHHPLPEQLHQLRLANMDLLIELFNYVKSAKDNNGNDVTTAMILGKWHNTQEGFLLASLAAEEILLEPTAIEQQFRDALKRLITQYFTKEIKKVQGDSPEERKRLSDLLQEKAKYQ